MYRRPLFEERLLQNNCILRIVTWIGKFAMPVVLPNYLKLRVNLYPSRGTFAREIVTLVALFRCDLCSLETLQYLADGQRA